MSKTSYNELGKNIESGNFSKLYFLCGEAYFVDKFKNIICEKILSKSKNDFNFVNITNEFITVENLEDTINTYPIGSIKKCVILNNLPLSRWDKEEFESFIKLTEDLPEFICLIIAQTETTQDTKSSNKLKKFQKAAEQNGCFVNFTINDIPIEKELIKWAKNDFGKILSSTVAQKIKQNCEIHTVAELKNELKKICEFESGDEITEQSLEVICKSQEKQKIFTLPKLILSGNAKKSFEMLEKLIDQGEDPISIVSVIASEYIDMFRVKALTEKGENTSKLTEIFDYKSKEFRIRNAESNCKKISMNKIQSCLKSLTEADIKLKSTALPQKLILDELVAKLLSQI